MLRCLCGSPSIPLSFILAYVLPRRSAYCVNCGTEIWLPTPSTHRLRRGLPGYLILFATHAFVPQRQLKASKSPSLLVFLLISTHFTATLGIPLTSPSLKLCSFRCLMWLSHKISHLTRITAYEPFTPNDSGQRSPPTYYRGCWHVVSRGFLLWYRHYLPIGQSFTRRIPSSLTRRRCIRVSPIVQYSPLLPPVGVWAVSQSQCGRSPSQAGYWSWPWWAFISPTS